MTFVCTQQKGLPSRCITYIPELESYFDAYMLPEIVNPMNYNCHSFTDNIVYPCSKNIIIYVHVHVHMLIISYIKEVKNLIMLHIQKTFVHIYLLVGLYYSLHCSFYMDPDRCNPMCFDSFKLLFTFHEWRDIHFDSQWSHGSAMTESPLSDRSLVRVSSLSDMEPGKSFERNVIAPPGDIPIVRVMVRIRHLL